MTGLFSSMIQRSEVGDQRSVKAWARLTARRRERATTDLRPLLFSSFQKTRQGRVHFIRVLLLHPVVALGEADFGVGGVHVRRDALDCLGDDGEVALAVDEEGGDADSLLLRVLAASAGEERAEVGAVVVDCGGQRAP